MTLRDFTGKLQVPVVRARRVTGTLIPFNSLSPDLTITIITASGATDTQDDKRWRLMQD